MDIWIKSPLKDSAYMIMNIGILWFEMDYWIQQGPEKDYEIEIAYENRNPVTLNWFLNSKVLRKTTNINSIMNVVILLIWNGFLEIKSPVEVSKIQYDYENRILCFIMD